MRHRNQTCLKQETFHRTSLCLCCCGEHDLDLLFMFPQNRSELMFNPQKQKTQNQSPLTRLCLSLFESLCFQQQETGFMFFKHSSDKTSGHFLLSRQLEVRCHGKSNIQQLKSQLSSQKFVETQPGKED